MIPTEPSVPVVTRSAVATLAPGAARDFLAAALDGDGSLRGLDDAGVLGRRCRGRRRERGHEHK